MHGAVLAAQYRGADDRPDHYFPEVPPRVRLENPLWQPAQVSPVLPGLTGEVRF